MIGKVIVLVVLFWFCWVVMVMMIMGFLFVMLNNYLFEFLILGVMNGFVVFKEIVIGLGMWFGLIMWFNVWFVIWFN